MSKNIGIFIDNLLPFVTVEMLIKEMDTKYNIEGYRVVKVVRDHTTNKSKGYGFCSFKNRDLAIAAKSKLNFCKIYGQEIRVALITSVEERSPENNFVISKIPPTVTEKQFDEEMSKKGAIISTRLINKNRNEQDQDDQNKNIIGFVQFLNRDEAQKFKENFDEEKKTIDFLVNSQLDTFIKYKAPETEKKNIYFNDYISKQYTEEEMQDEKFTSEESENIKKYLLEKLSVNGPIASCIVGFNKEFRKPYALACFEKADDAQKCIDNLNNDTEFHFKYKNYVLTKQEMKQQVLSQRNKKFIYFGNIKRDVTEAQLYKILSDMPLKVKSIRIKTPQSTPFKEYTTNFATIITEEENKLDFLKAAGTKDGQHFNQEFVQIFKDSNPFIRDCHPQSAHKKWVKNNIIRRSQQEYRSQPPLRGTQQLPPLMMPPSMMYGPRQYPPLPFNPMMMNNSPFGMPMTFGNMYMPPPGMGLQQQQQQQQQQPSMRMPMMYPPQFMQKPPQNPQQYQQQRPRHYNNNNNNQFNNNYQHRSQPHSRYQNQQTHHHQQQNHQQQQYQNRYQNQNQRHYQQRGQNQQRGGQPQPIRSTRAPVQISSQNPKPIGQVAQPVLLQQQQPSAPQPLSLSQQVKQIRANLKAFKEQEKKVQQTTLGKMLYPKVFQQAKDKNQLNQIIQVIVDFDNNTVEEILDMLEKPEELIDMVKQAEELLNEEEEDAEDAE